MDRIRPITPCRCLREEIDRAALRGGGLDLPWFYVDFDGAINPYPPFRPINYIPSDQRRPVSFAAADLEVLKISYVVLEPVRMWITGWRRIYKYLIHAGIDSAVPRVLWTLGD